MNEGCFACGGIFEAMSGPTHEYMQSSPGCWHGYGTLLAREYQDRGLFGAVHRLTVDAYALQHPGDPTDRRARQSIWVHYAALHLALHARTDHARIAPMMQKLVTANLPPLPPPPVKFDVTLADVLARGKSDHVAAVTAWANSAFRAWAALAEPTATLLEAVQDRSDDRHFAAPRPIR